MARSRMDMKMGKTCYHFVDETACNFLTSGLPIIPLYEDGDLTTTKFIQAEAECSSSPIVTKNCIFPIGHIISLLNSINGVLAGINWLLIFRRSRLKQCSYRIFEADLPSTYMWCIQWPPFSASIIIRPSIPLSSPRGGKEIFGLGEKLYVILCLATLSQDILFPLLPSLLNTPPSFDFCLGDLDSSRLILENTLVLGLRERLDMCLFSCSLVLIVFDSKYRDVPEHPSKAASDAGPPRSCVTGSFPLPTMFHMADVGWLGADCSGLLMVSIFVERSSVQVPRMALTLGRSRTLVKQGSAYNRDLRTWARLADFRCPAEASSGSLSFVLLPLDHSQLVWA
ncbi:hypothetical protein Tco_0850351 [Tanacetum coccineum]